MCGWPSGRAPYIRWGLSNHPLTARSNAVEEKKNKGPIKVIPRGLTSSNKLNTIRQAGFELIAPHYKGV
jgi:hypothetical protein